MAGALGSFPFLYMGSRGLGAIANSALRTQRPRARLAAARQSCGRAAQAFPAIVAPMLAAAGSTGAGPPCGQGICEKVRPSQKAERIRKNMRQIRAGGTPPMRGIYAEMFQMPVKAEAQIVGAAFMGR
jgi:hypothetical protein